MEVELLKMMPLKNFLVANLRNTLYIFGIAN